LGTSKDHWNAKKFPPCQRGKHLCRPELLTADLRGVKKRLVIIPGRGGYRRWGNIRAPGVCVKKSGVQWWVDGKLWKDPPVTKGNAKLKVERAKTEHPCRPKTTWEIIEAAKKNRLQRSRGWGGDSCHYRKTGGAWKG